MASTWVVANGVDEMDLSAVFLRVGVALIGPGDRGDFFDRREQYRRELEPQELRILEDFAERAQVGDRVLLRRKRGRSSHQVLALGLIVGPYRHEPIFQAVDVHQWDLQHCRRVRWKELEQPEERSLPPIRFSRLIDQDLLAFVDGLWAQHQGP